MSRQEKISAPGEDEKTTAIEEAVAATLAGDPEAYTLIVTTYAGKLHRTALYLCRYDSEAEDLVQETLIEGFLRLGSLREPAKLEAWLLGILKYKALRAVRRRARIDLVEEIPDAPDPMSPALAFAREEAMAVWRRRLESLSPTLRETAILYFAEELSMEAIARRTDVPLGTVKSRIHAARAAIRKELQMNEKTKTLPDGFVEAVEKKITELQNYHKLYGTGAGFDAAYQSLKTLIGDLSSKEDMKKYAVRGAQIAATVYRDAYGEEALATYRKWNDPRSASYCYFDLALNKHGSDRDYLAAVALPDIEGYPPSDEREAAIGYIHFWRGCCFIDADPPKHGIPLRRP